ncbi:MAG: tripartite tricarboxylate transporter TctB family protein [Defluviitaleaceae bacterium]|nr:tripartite tricarboxylate transporter TctB family protein [Defluviitaleaceae bacterium]
MSGKANFWDLITYSVLWIASIALYFWGIPAWVILRDFAWTADTGMDGRTLPNILAVGLFIVTSIGIAKTLPLVLKDRKAKTENNKNAAGAGIKAGDDLYTKIIPLLIFIASAIFIFMFSNFGFPIAVAIMAPVILALLKAKKWYCYVSVYAFAFILFIVFRQVLNVPIP